MIQLLIVIQTLTGYMFDILKYVAEGVIVVCKDIFALVMGEESSAEDDSCQSYSRKADIPQNRTIYMVKWRDSVQVFFTPQQALQTVKTLSSTEFKAFLARADPEIPIGNDPVQIMEVPDLDVFVGLLGEVPSPLS